jgi:cytochrome c oxidase subunit III
MSESSRALVHQFDDSEQQRWASRIGMWIFLATEVMFFGGMFAGYTSYRFLYPQAFALASNRLPVLAGSIMTVVLICSSLTMALAVHSAEEEGRRRSLMVFVALTMILGAVFLGMKFNEYYEHYEEHLVPGLDFRFDGANPGEAAIFFSFYYAMTGVHALHMLIGFGLQTYLLVGAWHDRFSPLYNTPVEIVGLYWHFVDIVWIFLFPLLYLVGRHL